jgi:hypothetical protein
MQKFTLSKRRGLGATLNDTMSGWRDTGLERSPALMDF